MRHEVEVQRAHDILSAVVCREIPVALSHHARQGYHAALDVLCWVLGHDHNPAFAANLAQIDAEAEAAGYRLGIRGSDADPS